MMSLVSADDIQLCGGEYREALAIAQGNDSFHSFGIDREYGTVPLGRSTAMMPGGPLKPYTTADRATAETVGSRPGALSARTSPAVSSAASNVGGVVQRTPAALASAPGLC